MTWTDTGRCGKTVPGNAQHCPVCHETFGSTSAGDSHRVGGWDRKGGPRRCLSPADVGLVLDVKGVWRYPSNGYKWPKPADGA